MRSTNFSYTQEPDSTGSPSPSYTFRQAVTQYGYVRSGDRYLQRGLSPLEFGYTLSAVQSTIEEADAESLENLPAGLQGAGYQ